MTMESCNKTEQSVMNRFHLTEKTTLSISRNMMHRSMRDLQSTPCANDEVPFSNKHQAPAPKAR